jgi:protocatechuate 3,4-dioxygenase beta subunit
MKKLILLASIIVISQRRALPQTPQTATTSPQTAAIVGTAVMQSTGQPLAKVYVDLRGPAWLSTTTEEDGKFYFPNVLPGQYHLYGRREGYALAEFGQRWSGGPGQLITLTAGQPAPDVKVGLTPTAVISGHITDLNGNPITGARVRAMKSAVQENRRTLRIAQEAVTNELGEYRLFWMAPGRYYVSATVQAWQVNSQIVNNPSAPVGDTTNAGLSTSRSVSRPETTKPIGTGVADDEVYIPIYFPRSADGEQAAAIDLQPGVELRSVDISVAPVRTYHVRGRITNLPEPSAASQNGGGGRGVAPPLPFGGAGGGRGAQGGGAAGGPTIQVRLAPDNWFGNVYSAQANGTTGDFEFPKVVNGGYTLYTFIDGTTTRMPVEVRNADVDGMTMPLATGVSLPVEITLDGEPPKNLPNISSLQIMLYRDPTLINAPAMNASSRGSSPLPNLSPGNYRIYVQPLLNPLNGTDPLVQQAQWQSAYVKSITLGDEEVLNAGLHYSPKPDSVLRVVIGTNPGTLEGRVLNDQQQLVPSAAVVLFVENPAARITRTDMFKVTSTDMAGRFQVKGLPPGDYKVFAWEGLDKDAWLDPDFVRSESRGQAVHVDEGKVQTVDVPVITPIR